MTKFKVTEDFPKSEIEFDQRFRDIDACYLYLASIKWPSEIFAQPPSAAISRSAHRPPVFLLWWS